MGSLQRLLLVVGVAVAAWVSGVASIGSAARASRTVVVKVRVNGAGEVRVAASRPPFTCRGGYVCTERLHVRPGRPLVFRALAARGWMLKAWQSGCHDSAATCSLPLKARLNVTVKFVQRPPTGLLGTLQAVACFSVSDCWAVGYHDTWKPQARLTEALHWDGTTWTQVATPNPAGTLSGDASQLSSVACVSSADCWATGSYYEGGGNGSAGVLALHWDGTTWKRTSIQAGGRAYEVRGVTCVSTSFCFMVGAVTPPSASGNLALRWNGASWQKIAVPKPSGSTSTADDALNGVTCTSATNCWAVGEASPSKNKPLRNQVLRWNGTGWRKAAVPNPSGKSAVSALNGVACAAASNCFAVGGHARYKALHWNGTAWRTTATNPAGKSGGHILNAVACPAASSCWAVGNDNETLHWNGNSWARRKAPKPAGTTSGGYLELYGVACTSTHNCWAVGSYGPATAHRPETLHWNGTRWTRFRS